ncbi:MAG: addiction module toxin, HicA family [Nitrospiraceae bacterium]|nr:MAG: addiction module toxin, HicA family [Nitrospiraceae bacterium]
MLTRSSGGHDMYHNPATKRSAPVPRHTEIANTLCLANSILSMLPELDCRR